MPSPPVDARRPASPPSAVASPLDALWQGGVIVWVVLAAEAIAAALTLAGDPPLGRWIRFGLLSLLVQWVALLSLGSLYVLREKLRDAKPLLIAYLAVALLVLSSWLVLIASDLLLGELWRIPDHEKGDVFLRATGIALIVGCLALAAFQNHWRARLLAVRAKQAELAALQARVRPHFLFNTLNTGAALVHSRPHDAEELLLDLADLFRAALNGPREIPLAEEIALVKRYLEIESLRFDERLRVHWDLPDPIPDVRLPSLSLQPLVENAIKHGVERIPAGGDIAIRLAQSEDAIEIVIENPLPPPDDSKGGRAGHNVGLPASLAQIESYTGGRGSVRAHAADGLFTVTVRLPAPQATTS